MRIMSQDFSKAKIYKLTNDFNDDVFIGATCDTLIKKFSYYKKAVNREANKDKNPFKLMREIGTARLRIDLIEEWTASDKQEMRMKLGKYTREMGTLNSKISGRTKKEYREDTNEKTKEREKEYREANKEKIKVNRKKYRENNKEKISEYTKEHYINNKDKVKERNKEWEENNKTKREEQKGEKTTCECGCILTKGNMSHHKRTKKHINLMKEKEEN
jgi:hypothetical protein